MDLPQEVDDYLRESLEYSLGLPVSTRTLEVKIRSSEETQRHILDQCFRLKSKLIDKDNTIECTRAESSMNAQALKKFVKENQKLVIERDDLVNRHAYWDNECSLYERDIETLAYHGNEVDERANEAESRVRDLEDETSKLSEKLEYFKQLSEEECPENRLIDTLISTLINSLNPSTHNVLALASEVKKLQKDKAILRVNLMEVEQEVTVLFNENSILNKEHARLTKPS